MNSPEKNQDTNTNTPDAPASCLHVINSIRSIGTLFTLLAVLNQGCSGASTKEAIPRQQFRDHLLKSCQSLKLDSIQSAQEAMITKKHLDRELTTSGELNETMKNTYECLQNLCGKGMSDCETIENIQSVQLKLEMDLLTIKSLNPNNFMDVQTAIIINKKTRKTASQIVTLKKYIPASTPNNADFVDLLTRLTLETEEMTQQLLIELEKFKNITPYWKRKHPAPIRKTRERKKQPEEQPIAGKWIAQQTNHIPDNRKTFPKN